MRKPFSPIQNHILSRLKNADFLRYSELQPPKVPNDLFNYHLQHLVKKSYVLKSEEGYQLAEKGLKHVADPYPENNAITSLYKMNVITIVSRIVDGRIEILNQRRQSHPSYGKVGVMGGVVLKGELLPAAASRKLAQETGLQASFRIVGCERRVMYKAGELFSDVLFPIAYADHSEGELIHTEFGENMWVPIEEAIHNDSGEFDSIASIVTVLRAIQDGRIASLPFFLEESVQSDDTLP